MTPGARVQAVIEVLEEAEAAMARGGAAADVVLRRYFTKRRYAGSGDRSAITDSVYAVLRHRAYLGWALQGAAAGKVTARSLVIARLALLDRLDADEISSLFSGEGYAPDSLTDGETEWIGRIAAIKKSPPEAVQLECPPAFEEHFRRRFGGAFGNEMSALLGRAPLGLRVNTLRTTVDAVISALAAEGIKAVRAGYVRHGLVVDGNPRLDISPLLRDGWIEVQDEGSQIATQLIDAAPRQQVAELCAGAGGKTLALAATMENTGQIYAFDTDARRLDSLRQRMTRADVRNVQIHRLPGHGDKRAGILRRFAGAMDRVVLDVPCSGSGTWRRSPELRWRFTPDQLEELVGVQKSLLAEGADLVKPGGRLIYITCSLFMDEDEDRISAFLARNPDFRLVPYQTVWPATEAGAIPDTLSSEPGCLLLTPGSHGTDGFFVAVMERSVATTHEIEG